MTEAWYTQKKIAISFRPYDTVKKAESSQLNVICSSVLGQV